MNPYSDLRLTTARFRLGVNTQDQVVPISLISKVLKDYDGVYNRDLVSGVP